MIGISFCEFEKFYGHSKWHSLVGKKNKFEYRYYAWERIRLLGLWTPFVKRTLLN